MPGGTTITRPSDNLDERPVAAGSRLADTVPVIDIGELVGDTAARADMPAVQAIADALRRWGFFQVIRHGVDDRLIEEVWQATRRFFALPQSQKDAILRTRENPWGYYNNELTKNRRDKKEVFDFTIDGEDPIYHAANRWPDRDRPFRDTMSRYLEAVTGLSLRLLEAFWAGLGLPPDYLEPQFAGDHTGFVRLNYYPVKDPMEGSDVPHQALADLGVHHHTDAGALTVLLQDEIGGLQVFRDDAWHDIPPVEGAFVINTGDMMQVWSNDIYQAAIHRVLAMERQDRYSIPFFFNPAATTRVSPLPSVVSDERPARYREIDWAEFRGKRTDGDYADYGTEVQISQYRT